MAIAEKQAVDTSLRKQSSPDKQPRGGIFDVLKDVIGDSRPNVSIKPLDVTPSNKKELPPNNTVASVQEPSILN